MPSNRRNQPSPCPSGLLDRLVRDGQDLVLDSNDPYLISYPEFIRYFQSIPLIQRHHLIIGASFTYSWMPTILGFNSGEFVRGAEILNKARRPEMISEADHLCLVKLVNNSVTGVSKLLHFVNPEVYMIWDSWVCRWLWRSSCNSTKLQVYRETLPVVQEGIKQPAFDSVHESICQKLGYKVTRLRAADLVMFMAGKRTHGTVRSPVGNTLV